MDKNYTHLSNAFTLACWMWIYIYLFILHLLHQTPSIVLKKKISLSSFFLSHCRPNRSANPPKFTFKIYPDQDHPRHLLLTTDSCLLHDPYQWFTTKLLRQYFLKLSIAPCFPSTKCCYVLPGLSSQLPPRLTPMSQLPLILSLRIPTWCLYTAALFSWNALYPDRRLGNRLAHCTSWFIFSVTPLLATWYRISASLLLLRPALLIHFTLLYHFIFP